MQVLTEMCPAISACKLATISSSDDDDRMAILWSACIMFLSRTLKVIVPIGQRACNC